MNIRPEISLEQQLAAAQSWWRDAGVDHLFLDQPEAWLIDEEQPVNQGPITTGQPPDPHEESNDEGATPAFVASELPGNLADFYTWWLDAERFVIESNGPRMCPRGSAGAKIMLLIPMPEADDSEQLLSGPQGELLRNIVRALGIDDDAAYFASVLPGHLPLPDWPALAKSGLGTVIAHHITLVRPERILWFGNSPAELLGLPANGPANLTETEIPALTTRAPEHLLANPRQRARLWNNLLEWTAHA